MPAAAKPLELVRLEGNPNHRKIDKETPHFVPLVPPCPDYIDEVGRVEWERLAPQLEKLGLLTSADFAAFACYCIAYSEMVAATRALADGKMTNQYDQVRAEISIRNKAMKSIKDFAIQFGFTPSARGRIELPDPGDGSDEDLD